MAGLRNPLLPSAILAVAIAALMTRALADDLNDYPTSARADYVFACMKANGETQELLQKCSCSIDVIASIIPYDRYVAAETILSMSQVTGPSVPSFDPPSRPGLRCRNSAVRRRKRKSVVSEPVAAAPRRYSIDFSIDHWSLKACLLVSIASARKLAAPFGL